MAENDYLKGASPETIYKMGLQDIIVLGAGYDGFESAESLKGLIDDMVKIAVSAINHEAWATKA